MTAQRVRPGGFSLVELMVAIALGAMLLAGLVQVFVSNRATYEVNEDLARLQENARFALEALVADIRMVGYVGCMDEIGSVTNGLNSTQNLTLLNNALEGFEQGESSWSPSSSTASVGSVVANTDAITVRFFEGRSVSVIAPFMSTPSADIKIAANDLKQGEIVAMTDCLGADVFQVRNAHPSSAETVEHGTGTVTPGNTTASLSKNYAGDARLHRFVARRYYIGNGTNGPSLFRESMSSGTAAAPGALELVEGVENMQITYGEDTDGDRAPDAYRDADDVVNWSQVINVRIGLLFRTVDEYGTDVDTATYDVNGFTVDPTDDRRRRRVIHTTVLVRNLQ